MSAGFRLSPALGSQDGSWWLSLVWEAVGHFDQGTKRVCSKCSQFSVNCSSVQQGNLALGCVLICSGAATLCHTCESTCRSLVLDRAWWDSHWWQSCSVPAQEARVKKDALSWACWQHGGDMVPTWVWTVGWKGLSFTQIWEPGFLFGAQVLTSCSSWSWW